MKYWSSRLCDLWQFYSTIYNKSLKHCTLWSVTSLVLAFSDAFVFFHVCFGSEDSWKREMNKLLYIRVECWRVYCSASWRSREAHRSKILWPQNPNLCPLPVAVFIFLIRCFIPKSSLPKKKPKMFHCYIGFHTNYFNDIMLLIIIRS